MKQLLVCFLMVVITATAYAQNFSAVDAHATNTPTNLKRNIDKLALYLTEPFDDDVDKVRSIYVWLATHINYDVRAANSISRVGFETVKDADERNQEIIKNTLRDSKGVCQGYALSFKKMCDIAGIKNHVVVGFSKKEDGNVFTKYPSHAWNAAFINGQWYLFDVTWGAGFVSGNSFTKRLSNDFFMADAETFRKRHLPADPMWQLSNSPISFNNFIGNAEGEIWKENFNFIDSLDAYYQLPQDLMPLKTARNAYNFDPVNSSRIVVAYSNYANKWANSALRAQKRGTYLLENLLRDNQRAIEAQQIAYSMDQSETIKNGLGIYYANHASYLNDQAFKWVQQGLRHDNAIELRQQAILFLDKAARYHKNRDFITEAYGFTYSGMAYTYLKKAIKQNHNKEYYQNALDYYYKAEAYFKGLRTPNAKNGLSNCRNNIDAIKNNLSIIQRNN